MRLAFVAKPGYEGVSGTVVYGSAGETLNLKEALDGGTEIVSDNPRVQESLRGLQGLDGPVFDVHTVDAEGNKELEEPAPSLVAPAVIAKKKRSRAERVAQAQSADIGAIPAQHGGSGSGYEGLNQSDLEHIARDRGIEFKAGSTEAELIEALEQHDAKEASK